MRVTLAACVAALVFPASAATILPPVNDYGGGGAGWYCRWNPYAHLEFNAGQWFWTGEFQWFDPPGNPTGIPCV